MIPIRSLPAVRAATARGGVQFRARLAHAARKRKPPAHISPLAKGGAKGVNPGGDPHKTNASHSSLLPRLLLHRKRPRRHRLAP